MPRTVAVVPAAGSGQRLGAGRPKAFVHLAERTLMEHALAGLRESGAVDAVVVAVPADLTDEATLILGGHTDVVAGGASRADSVRRAVAAAGSPDWVLVHDAARALTPPAVITRVVEALRAGHDAVVPAVPVPDTIKAVGADAMVVATPERSGLRAVQTPQGFRTGVLLRAFDRVDPQRFTDCSSMVEQLGVAVRVVDGDPLAFKITTPLDLVLARAVAGDER